MVGYSRRRGLVFLRAIARFLQSTCMLLLMTYVKKSFCVAKNCCLLTTVSSKRHVCICVDTNKQRAKKKKIVSEGMHTHSLPFRFTACVVHTRREKEFIFLVTTALVKTLQNTSISLSLSPSLLSRGTKDTKKKRDGGERRRNTKKRSNSEEEDDDDDDGALERARGVRRFCVFVRAIFAIEARSSAVRCWR